MKTNLNYKDLAIIWDKLILKSLLKIILEANKKFSLYKGDVIEN